MPSLTVLTIGLTLSFAAKRAWERRGVFVTFAPTTWEAVSLLQNGDFDLCVLDQSVPRENRARLVSVVRDKLHSNVPVILVDGDGARVEEPGGVRALPPNGVAIVEQLASEAKRSGVRPIDGFDDRYKRTA